MSQQNKTSSSMSNEVLCRAYRVYESLIVDTTDRVYESLIVDRI